MQQVLRGKTARCHCVPPPSISRPEIYRHFPSPVWQIADKKKKKKRSWYSMFRCTINVKTVFLCYYNIYCHSVSRANIIVGALSLTGGSLCRAIYCTTTNVIMRVCENCNRFPILKWEFVNRPDFQQIFSPRKYYSSWRRKKKTLIILISRRLLHFVTR